jgi:serine/threonine protein kinase
MGGSQGLAIPRDEERRYAVIEAPWEKVRDLLDSAIELPQAERSKYLDEHCTDSQVRRSVDALIESYEESATFLEKPAIPTFPDLDHSWTGRMLGPYKLLEEIGSGGMGIVFRAIRADDEYLQNVAIKIVSGVFVSKQLVDHFRAERQMLANLNHPNVARLLDGGTTAEGLPYLVMEFIEGTPIDEYCDTHRLPLRERLALFAKLCGAVQYAHQNLIVHRDLKPGNILVTAEGTPKLLDFGIAKLLQPVEQRAGNEQAVTLQPMMTPEYASPEQFESRPVTTASDVYSLGVVFYLLLTGRRRYVKTPANAHNSARAIATEAPIRPSTAIGRAEDSNSGNKETTIATVVNNRRAHSVERLRKELAGDLDAIVLKALEKDTARRYASAEQFAEDIRRYLAGKPVEARLPTVRYRVAKFVRRHVVAVAAAALISIGSVIAVGWIVRAERAASRERTRAEQRFNDLRKLSNALIFDLHNAVENLPGAVDARRKIVSLGLQYLDSLEADAAGDISLQREVAMGYRQIASIQGRQGTENLGHTAEAIASYKKAERIQEGIVNSNSVVDEDRWNLAGIYMYLSHTLSTSGGHQTALAYDHKALALLEQIPTGYPTAFKNENRKGITYDYVAHEQDALGDPAAALENYAKATAIYEQVAGSKEGHSLGEYNLAQAYLAMSVTWCEVANYDRARDSAEKSLELRKVFYKYNPNDVQAQLDMAESYDGMADVQAKQRELGAALDSYVKGRTIAETAATADPKDQRAQEDLAVADRGLSESLRKRGNLREALNRAKQAVEISSKMASADPLSAANQELLAESYASLGDIYKTSGMKQARGTRKRSLDVEQALTSYQKAERIYSDLRARNALTFGATIKLGRVSQEIAGSQAVTTKSASNIP